MEETMDVGGYGASSSSSGSGSINSSISMISLLPSIEQLYGTNLKLLKIDFGKMTRKYKASFDESYLFRT